LAKYHHASFLRPKIKHHEYSHSQKHFSCPLLAAWYFNSSIFLFLLLPASWQTHPRGRWVESDLEL
jgi:hypothetical protein